MREGLMNALQKEGYDVYVLTHVNRHKEKVEATGLKVIDVGSGNINPIMVGKYIWRLFTEIRKIRPDVILTFSVRPAIWGNFVARMLKIPVITNITGTGPLFESNNLAYRIIRAIYPLALKKTKLVFFQNYDDQAGFIERRFVSQQQTARIPGSGVDYHKFDPKHFIKTNKESFDFLFIGRLIIDKGIMEFIDASKELKAKYPTMKFKIIGPFWQQNLKLNQISRRIIDTMVESGVIEYLGEKKDVRKYIADADCIVLPSYREGTSNVLLESASMERPVIASDVTGCREIVDHNLTGYLCRPKDAFDLAQKMETMYQLPEEERVRMGKRGREKVIKEFDKQIVITTYLKSIENIMGLPST